MGLVIAANNEANLAEITRLRTVAAVPFGGRYRLIDFVLSALVNSGIDNVGIATDHKYQSLLNHLGNGKPWDLARKKEGLLFLPPYSREPRGSGDNRIAVLTDSLGFFRRSKQQYVVLCDCNNVCNIRFEPIVELHKQRNADITVVYQKVAEKAQGETYIELNADCIATDIVYAKDKKKCLNRMVGFYVINKDLLIPLIEECQLHEKTQFIKDIIERNLNKLSIYGHNFTGYLRTVNSVQTFYDVSMELLNTDARVSLFMQDDKILTKSKDRIPTRYLSNAAVKGSIVADGCIIDGEVSDSIISRGVTIGKGAVVKGSIVMPDCTLEANSHIENCIFDKAAVIRSGKTLMGTPDFPVIVGKRRTI
jgi:glucose-1-phosphate adenylyltransferase